MARPWGTLYSPPRSGRWHVHIPHKTVKAHPARKMVHIAACVYVAAVRVYGINIFKISLTARSVSCGSHKWWSFRYKPTACVSASIPVVAVIKGGRLSVTLGSVDWLPGNQRKVVNCIFVAGLGIGHDGGQRGFTSGLCGGGERPSEVAAFMYF